MKNMEATLREAVKNFNLVEALELTDKMHDIDAQRDLTFIEDNLWLKLTVKIEQARASTFFEGA